MRIGCRLNTLATVATVSNGFRLALDSHMSYSMRFPSALTAATRGRSASTSTVAVAVVEQVKSLEEITDMDLNAKKLP